VASHLNIGHRHLLPIYAPLLVLCGGAAAEPLPGRWARRALWGLLAVLAVETAWWFPNYLAYFNGIVRPSGAYRHLVDSSLDWGQDLPAVKRYIDGHPGEGPFYLSYFGAGSPAYYGIGARPLRSFGGRYLEEAADLLLADLPEQGVPGALARLRREDPAYDLMGVERRGGVPCAVLLRRPADLRLSAGTYLISATMLASVCDWDLRGPWTPGREAAYRRLGAALAPLLDPDIEVRRSAFSRYDAEALRAGLYRYEQYKLARLAAGLRDRVPDATLNYSILVYRLTQAEATRAPAMGSVPPQPVPAR
jgi:hypothetical protein